MTTTPSESGIRGVLKSLGIKAAILIALTACVSAAVAQQLQIEAKPLPGQLDVLQGTAFQLGGTPPDTGPRPTSYSWEILEGEGGEILQADQSEAIFRAPVLEEKSLEIFVIQLTAEYPGQEPARARLHVRVHKELPEKSAEQVAEEEEIASYIKGLTKRQKRKLAKEDAGVWAQAVARLALGDLDLEDSSTEGVMSYAPGLSAPGGAAAGDSPPSFIWEERVVVDEDRMTEYVALAKRLREAYEAHSQGYGWLVYGNAIGGDDNELVYYYDFESFAEIDGWPSRQEVLTKAIGDRDAARLLAALDSMTDTTTSLWQLEPELSQLGGD